MKLLITICAVLFSFAMVNAEIYSWTDGAGTMHFTEDYSQVPKKYRNKLTRHAEDEDAPSTAPAAPRPAKAAAKPAVSAPLPAGSAPVKGRDGKLLYGGRPVSQWQNEFRARESAYKSLENRLDQLAGQIKRPVGIPRERRDALPQEFKATQQEYLKALKEYNDLNDAANRAGLPAEFRK
ncbi:MAG TPA: DUF4124 domain-containing protein [Deltaproteobacteria bacterium]|nr:DUF4124 domain-containing protein [Deltaproteobacteria bacterium]HQB39199.1 DUF4124 domain-containing protein [Deltaproteobacteria bacterium]